jgi:cell division protein FtsI/penicillin-binding protein 2
MTEPATDRLPEDEAPRRLAGQNRIRLIAICFGFAFLAIAGQLTRLTIFPMMEEAAPRIAAEDRLPRPDIIDRNGVLLATDVAVASLYADPSKIIDIDEAIELLTATVPDLDARELRVRGRHIRESLARRIECHAAQFLDDIRA